MLREQNRSHHWIIPQNILAWKKSAFIGLWETNHCVNRVLRLTIIILAKRTARHSYSWNGMMIIMRKFSLGQQCSRQPAWHTVLVQVVVACQNLQYFVGTLQKIWDEALLVGVNSPLLDCNGLVILRHCHADTMHQSNFASKLFLLVV